MDPGSHGVFHAGDSYIVQYTYGDEAERKNHVIYFWQGRDSTADEKGASALLATSLSDSLGGGVPQIRVAMGKEPDHFYSLFAGRMVVRRGGVEGGFRTRAIVGEAGSGTDDDDGVALFHVRGTDDVNTRAVQVSNDASALNSGDCFVLVLDQKVAAAGIDGEARVFAWNGRGCSEDEKVCAHRVAAAVLAPAVGLASTDVEVIDEGAEPDHFWAPIGRRRARRIWGGVRSPPGAEALPDLRRDRRRIAHRVRRNLSFCQDDLCDDDVMLLDVTNEVFLWCGVGANENERREARTLAAAYVAACAERDGRDPGSGEALVAVGVPPGVHVPLHRMGRIEERAGRGGRIRGSYEAKLAAARRTPMKTHAPPAFASHDQEGHSRE